MRFLKSIICLSLMFSIPVYGENFPKGIKYLGGPGFPDKKEIRNSWDNSLNITDEEITLGFRKHLIETEAIPVTSITRITYGQATTRRVGRWVAVGILLAPVALVGIFHKSHQHRVLLEWIDDQERDRAMLMQVHKDHFVSVLNDLSFRTGEPIYADSEDREWLFRSGVRAKLDAELGLDNEETDQSDDEKKK